MLVKFTVNLVRRSYKETIPKHAIRSLSKSSVGCCSHNTVISLNIVNLKKKLTEKYENTDDTNIEIAPLDY
jgi:hypothetical protein